MRLLGSVPTVLTSCCSRLLSICTPRSPLPARWLCWASRRRDMALKGSAQCSMAKRGSLGTLLLSERSESMKTESGPCDLWFRCTLHKSLLAAHQGCSVFVLMRELRTRLGSYRNLLNFSNPAHNNDSYCTDPTCCNNVSLKNCLL